MIVWPFRIKDLEIIANSELNLTSISQYCERSSYFLSKVACFFPQLFISSLFFWPLFESVADDRQENREVERVNVMLQGHTLELNLECKELFFWCIKLAKNFLDFQVNQMYVLKSKKSMSWNKTNRLSQFYYWRYSRCIG